MFCHELKGLVVMIVAVPLILVACSQSQDGQREKPMIPACRDEWKLLEVHPKDSDELWLFRKNIGASEIKGYDGLPTLVYFTIKYAPRDATGLPTEKDTQLLYDFEEQVIPVVEQEGGCVYVASVIKGGLKDHLFYVSDPDLFIRVINQHGERLTGFLVSLEKHDDPRWAIYDDFPGDDDEEHSIRK